MKSDAKATARPGNTGGKSASGVLLESTPPPQRQDRIERIATAAYYKAEARGFMAGREMDDWLAAEAEIGDGTGSAE
ncbi:MAG: DUF2934 domain-containing protein [Rhodocyclaceae bacterium]|nr:DUF2934 domain-containing protein [Rhodocyclaceae bacterium]